MFTSRFVFAALLASASLTACVGLDDDESLGETTSDLSSSSWTSVADLGGGLSYPPAIAMLNGVEYHVFAYDDSPLPGPLSHELYWDSCDATTCSGTHRIPGQLSMDRVSLAAFNGRIYMVHQGDTDSKQVWFTSLNPATGQWTTNVELPFTTLGGSPALAAFNNQLYIVGSHEVPIFRGGKMIKTYPLWYATMAANEQWSAMRPIASESASPPSLAVLGNTLYLAHRNGATGDIAIQSLFVNGGWSAPARIPAGPSNSYIQGDDVQLAAVNGYLHLVHHRFSGNLTYWTYNRGCDAWAPEVSVDAFSSSSESTLATVQKGLVLTRLVHTGLWPYTINHEFRNLFIAPPAPLTLPNCGAQI